MKRNFFPSLVIVMAISIVFLAGCGGGTKDQKANEEVADSIKQELTLTPEARNSLYELPTPFEVTDMLKQAEAGYIFDITNPTGNVGKYMTEKSKAINLGIYSADLAYSATYNHKVKEFNNNKDSLVALVSNIFIATNDFLSKNNRNQVAVYIVSGAFLEGLYLASSLNIVAKDNTMISGIIFQQADNYGKMMIILDLYKNDENMKSVYDEMFKLKTVFTDYVQEPGKPLAEEKAFEINDLIESIRNTFIQ